MLQAAQRELLEHMASKAAADSAARDAAKHTAALRERTAAIERQIETVQHAIAAMQVLFPGSAACPVYCMQECC